MKDEPSSLKDDIVRRVKDAAILLSEHVDTVQIFVTFHAESGEETSCYEYGQGNFYARQGQVDEWLTFQREYQRCEARRRDGVDRE